MWKPENWWIHSRPKNSRLIGTRQRKCGNSKTDKILNGPKTFRLIDTKYKNNSGNQKTDRFLVDLKT